MQSKKSVEVDRPTRGTAGWLGNRDRRTHRVVRALAVRHDNVERISGATLEETDENLAVGSPGQLHAERRPAEEARTESHRDQRDRARFYECSAFHESLLAALEFGGPECKSHDLR